MNYDEWKLQAPPIVESCWCDRCCTWTPDEYLELTAEGYVCENCKEDEDKN